MNLTALIAPAVFFFLTAAVAEAAPITQPMQAVLRMRTAKDDAAQNKAVKDVVAACRGKLRHSLRGDAALKKEVRRWGSSERAATRKASLDLEPCFTPADFAPLVAARLKDTNAKVVSYAAEVAARLADPAILPALLSGLEQRKKACLNKGLKKQEIEHCVWFSYAPGAVLESASADERKLAAAAAVVMFASPYAKVREVAVETVASSKVSAHSKDIKALIAKEKKGGFDPANSKELLKRFAARAKTLAKG